MRRAYRRHTVRLLIAALWLVPTVFFAVFALDLSPDGVPVPTGQRVAFGVLAALFGTLALRTARIGVFTRPDGVTVRGVLRSRRLRWEEIEAFEWGRWRGWGSFDCGVVRRADGSQITVFALNPPFELTAGQDRRVPEMLAALNNQLAQARGWPEPPPSGAPGPVGEGTATPAR
jgi:hypothetical protein